VTLLDKRYVLTYKSTLECPPKPALKCPVVHSNVLHNRFIINLINSQRRIGRGDKPRSSWFFWKLVSVVIAVLITLVLVLRQLKSALFI